MKERLCYVVALFLVGVTWAICLPCTGWADEEPWFVPSQDLEIIVPATDKYGIPTGEEAPNGANAAAVFDANLDGRQDVVLIAGDSYFVGLNLPDEAGTPYFVIERYQIGVVEDNVRHVPACFGLQDFNQDGALDLYLANRGKGTLITACVKTPNDKGLYYSPLYSTLLSRLDGTFGYDELGIDGDGNKKTSVFDDFDGDGNFDAYLSVSPYYGPSWPQSESPNQLYPGTDEWNAFGPDAIDTMLVNVPEDFWHDAEGKGTIDFKGVVVRDFDRDGKPDIVTGAYADIWNPACFPTLWTTQPGTEGFQGDWYRGIFVFHNISAPGRIRFEDVSHSAIENAYGKTDQMHVYSALPADIDNDGDLDLLVSGVRNFTAQNSEIYMVNIVRVYRNDSRPGDIRFTDITEESGVDFMNDNNSLPGMYQGGFVRTVYGQTITLVPQLHAAAAVDIDNDGDRDWVAIDRQLLDFDPDTEAPLDINFWVFENDGTGHFTLADPKLHGIHGLAVDLSLGDFNQDGKTDIVAAGGSRGGLIMYPPHNYVYLNHIENGNHYLNVSFKLEGPNTFAIGTKVTLTQPRSGAILGYDEIRTDFSYGSKKDASLHFGLGPVETVDMQFEIPGGYGGYIKGLAADQAYTLKVVKIDIWPGTNTNLIHLGPWGIIPVAVLGTDEFEASKVDATSVVFAGEKPLFYFRRDLDHDGKRDLLCFFSTRNLELNRDSTVAELTGRTFDGLLVHGRDKVKILGGG